MDKYCKDCGSEPLRYNNRSGFCKNCYDRNRPRTKKGSIEYEQTAARQKENYRKNIDRERARARTWRFSLSIEDFNSMRENQNYSCKICKRHEEEVGTLHVDHDHSCCKTSRGEKTCGLCIRGLLCRDCNHGLGNFNDDPERLKEAISYIINYIRIADDIKEVNYATL